MATHSNKITLIGVGRLGICTALVLESRGFHVKGVDLSQSYCDSITNKTLKSNEPHVEDLLKNSQNLTMTTSLEEGLVYSDMIWILVDTPSGGRNSYDTTKLSKVLANINALRVENKHIVIVCTVYPGYIAQVGRFLLKDCKNTSLSYNPEFIAQGNIVEGFRNPDMVLIGEGSKEAGDRLEEIYKSIVVYDPTSAHPLNSEFDVCRVSPESAEIVKLGVNCFVTTKVSFANMIGDICQRTPGADAQEVCAAIGCDSRVGAKYLKPGYGFGGPCFPRDNRALGAYAQSVGIDPMIPTATDDTTNFIPS